MKIDEEYRKFLECIKIRKGEGFINFKKIEEKRLDYADVKWWEQEMKKDGIAVSSFETRYHPAKPQSTESPKMPNYSTTPSPIYNQEVLVFQANEKKLKAALSPVEKNNRLIAFIKEGNKGILNIKNFKPITFLDCRCKLINFFYNCEDKTWKSYDDIEQVIPEHTTETVRKSIIAINERVAKETRGKYPEIIQRNEDKSRPKATLSYRWRY